MISTPFTSVYFDSNTTICNLNAYISNTFYTMQFIFNTNTSYSYVIVSYTLSNNTYSYTYSNSANTSIINTYPSVTIIIPVNNIYPYYQNCLI